MSLPMFRSSQAGYTLVEIIVAMGIFAVLTGLIAINFIRPQVIANIDTTALMIFSYLKNQQNKALIGDATNQSTSQAYGIYFGPTSYTLFQGNSYSAASASNVVIPLSGVTVTTNFPSSQVVFTRISGEVSAFSASTNRITVSASGQQKILTVNRYGVITLQ